MVSSSSSWNISWLLSISCWKRSLSPQINLVFNENFETVPHLRSKTVPENWAQLVASSK